MKYKIRYQHTSDQTAQTKELAIRAVKLEARVNRLYCAETPDGIYCYTSQKDKNNVDTGGRAFAVILI